MNAALKQNCDDIIETLKSLIIDEPEIKLLNTFQRHYARNFNEIIRKAIGEFELLENSKLLIQDINETAPITIGRNCTKCKKQWLVKGMVDEKEETKKVEYDTYFVDKENIPSYCPECGTYILLNNIFRIPKK